MNFETLVEGRRRILLLLFIRPAIWPTARPTGCPEDPHALVHAYYKGRDANYESQVLSIDLLDC